MTATTTTTTTTPTTTTTTTTITMMIGLADRKGRSIPTDTMMGDPLDSGPVRDLLLVIGKNAPGFTIIPTIGGWTDKNGQLIMERSAKIETMVSSENARVIIGEIVAGLHRFLVETDQECAMLHTPEGGWTDLESDDPRLSDVVKMLSP